MTSAELPPVTIVGGGIMGAALAWALSERGFPSELIEANEVAAGASGGLGYRGVRTTGRAPYHVAAMRASQILWATIGDRLNVPSPFIRTGSLRVYEELHATLSGGAASIGARAELHRAYGVDSEVLGPEAIAEIQPGIGVPIVAGLYCPGDGIVDHTAATRAFAAAARAGRANLREHFTVANIAVRGGRVVEVESEAGDVLSVRGIFVIAAGAGSVALLGKSLGVWLPAWTANISALVVRSPDDPIRLLIGHDSRRISIKRIDRDTVMISGGWTVPDKSGSAPGADSEAIVGNLAEAVRLFPHLAAADKPMPAVLRAELVTVDARPVLDRLPGFDNVILAAGWSGEGFAVAPVFAGLLAEWLDLGKRPAALEPFMIDRLLPTAPVASAQ
jgi:sarcosine oxidase subunit beta